MDRKRFGFNIGDAFPAESPLARWIVGLCRISNDMATVNRLRQISHRAPFGQIAYLVRLWAGHYREGVKFLSEWHGVRDVQTFVSALPDDARDAYEGILASGAPWDESWVKHVFKPIRDTVFHYPSLQGDKEFQWAIDHSSLINSSATLLEEERFVEADFADEINMVWLMFGQMSRSTKEEMGMTLDVLRTGTQDFHTLSFFAVRSYLATLPSGVVVEARSKKKAEKKD